MVQCELCGKKFKNTQGLRGHKFFYHGINESKKHPATPIAAEQLLSELESRLEQVEELTHQNTERLTKQLEQHAHKLIELSKHLNNLTQQIRLASTKNEYRIISSQVTQLIEQVRRHDRWLTPDEIGLFICEILDDPPAFLVELNNLVKRVNDNQGVINWVRKKFNLVKKGAK